MAEEFQGMDGEMSDPCIQTCVDPCQVDCGCWDLVVTGCVETENCEEPNQGDAGCAPVWGTCKYVDQVHFFGIQVTKSLLIRAAAHGGIQQLEIYGGGECPVGEQEPDRIVAWPWDEGGCPPGATPVASLLRDEIMPDACGECNPCADYPVVFLLRANDEKVLVCCVYCLRLCDVGCPDSSSSSSSSSSASSSSSGSSGSSGSSSSSSSGSGDGSSSSSSSSSDSGGSSSSSSSSSGSDPCEGLNVRAYALTGCVGGSMTVLVHGTAPPGCENPTWHLGTSGAAGATIDEVIEIGCDPEDPGPHELTVELLCNGQIVCTTVVTIS